MKTKDDKLKICSFLRNLSLRLFHNSWGKLFVQFLVIIVFYFSTVSWVRLQQEKMGVNITFERRDWQSNFVFIEKIKRVNGSVGWIDIQERNINQKFNNTMSVMLCTWVTLVKKNPYLVPRIVSFNTAGLHLLIFHMSAP